MLENLKKKITRKRMIALGALLLFIAVIL